MTQKYIQWTCPHCEERNETPMHEPDTCFVSLPCDNEDCEESGQDDTCPCEIGEITDKPHYKWRSMRVSLAEEGELKSAAQALGKKSAAAVRNKLGKKKYRERMKELSKKGGEATAKKAKKNQNSPE